MYQGTASLILALPQGAKGILYYTNVVARKAKMYGKSGTDEEPPASCSIFFFIEIVVYSHMKWLKIDNKAFLTRTVVQKDTQTIVCFAVHLIALKMTDPCTTRASRHRE